MDTLVAARSEVDSEVAAESVEDSEAAVESVEDMEVVVILALLTWAAQALAEAISDRLDTEALAHRPLMDPRPKLAGLIKRVERTAKEMSGRGGHATQKNKEIGLRTRGNVSRFCKYL